MMYTTMVRVVVVPRCSSSSSQLSGHGGDTSPSSSSGRRKISRSRRLRQQGRIQKSLEDLKEESNRLYVRTWW